MVPPMPSVENLLKIGGKDAKSSKKHTSRKQVSSKCHNSAEKRKDVTISVRVTRVYWRCRFALGSNLSLQTTHSSSLPVLHQLSEKVASKAPRTPLIASRQQVWGPKLGKDIQEKRVNVMIKWTEGDDMILF